MINLFRGEHRFLSNFFIEPDGSCVEMEYQAAKAINPQDVAFIMSSSTPGKAKRRGRSITLWPQWEGMKLKVMLRLVRAKFSDEAMKKLLLATGDEELIEGNTWGDTYWGRCNNAGMNWLGRILMQVRKELKESKEVNP